MPSPAVGHTSTQHEPVQRPPGHADRRPATGNPWAGTPLDPSAPSAARVYDYLLGGSHNLPVDQALSRTVLAAQPLAGRYAQENRAFMNRAVRWLLAKGVRQFLDLGSGLLTVGNVHDIAHHADPPADVVYVDIDPVAVTYGQLLLHDEVNATAIRGDIRHPHRVWRDAVNTGLLDPGRPVGVLLVAVLHYVPNIDQPAQILRSLAEAAAPGSYLVVSHASPPEQPNAAADTIVTAFDRAGIGLTLRTPQQVAGLLDGWQLLPPGLVTPSRWHSEPDTGPPLLVPACAGIATKPASQP